MQAKIFFAHPSVWLESASFYFLILNLVIAFPFMVRIQTGVYWEDYLFSKKQRGVRQQIITVQPEYTLADGSLAQGLSSVFLFC